jgi:hypothetical protein
MLVDDPKWIATAFRVFVAAVRTLDAAPVGARPDHSR